MRLVPFGTPSRTKNYVIPAGRLTLYAISLGAGLVLLLLLCGVF
jgi:hypothetical protein